jgi:hypothetical protein
MPSIKAHIYNDQLEAESSINLINSTLGIPISVDAITQTYTSFEFNNEKYIIKHDEVIESILGLPSDFDYIEIINEFI